MKFVDGAWLARMHHWATPFHFRPVTRIAWQLFSEELGDGDLSKNHVHLYSNLLQSFGSKLPAGDSPEFMNPETNSNHDGHVWAAAIVQLALGLLPDEFFPEALGFTLAYECVAFDTRVIAHELRELELDPTYFRLHITIDNEDTGHTAMALDAAIKFLEATAVADRQHYWRRVQAGFLLATEIPSAPRLPSPIELDVSKIFSHKLHPGNTAHQLCRGVIG